MSEAAKQAWYATLHLAAMAAGVVAVLTIPAHLAAFEYHRDRYRRARRRA